MSNHRPRYKTKMFKGLVRHGAARWRMYAEHFARVSKMEAKGYYTALDAMEARAPFVARKARPVGFDQ